MRKIINSETQRFEDVMTDNLVLDAKATVGSFNGITSDAVARAVAGASGEVPEVTESDNGKILTAVYDAGGPAVEWADAPETPDELPEYTTTDDGKVLGVVVDSSGDTPVAGLDWVDQPADELPSIDGNAGKVLQVNAGATGVEWATPSGGSGLPALPSGADPSSYNYVLTEKTDGTGPEWDTRAAVPMCSSSHANKYLKCAYNEWTDKFDAQWATLPGGLTWNTMTNSYSSADHAYTGSTNFQSQKYYSNHLVFKMTSGTLPANRDLIYFTFITGWGKEGTAVGFAFNDGSTVTVAVDIISYSGNMTIPPLVMINNQNGDDLSGTLSWAYSQLN